MTAYEDIFWKVLLTCRKGEISAVKLLPDQWFNEKKEKKSLFFFQTQKNVGTIMTVLMHKCQVEVWCILFYVNGSISERVIWFQNRLPQFYKTQHKIELIATISIPKKKKHDSQRLWWKWNYFCIFLF